MRFGRLVVIRRDEDNIAPSGYRTPTWLCMCDCGNKVTVRGKSLTGGVTQSCGCLAKELVSERASKHHGYGTRLYPIWNSMRQRCNNPHNQAYKNYGGRGISICDEWDDFAVFREWALANGYDENASRGECTLDRIDANGNYCPENCRWVGMREQTNNRRKTVFITYNGKTLPLTKWADETGIRYSALWERYKHGVEPAELFANPIDQ